MEHTFRCDSKTALVQTTKGKVKGYELDGVSIFKGITYAKAERFHAPEPVEPWEGVFDATSFGYICPQVFSKPCGELMVPHRFWPMDEDCLNLNIWTPACDNKARPVMVWFHGGGFDVGASMDHLAYEGENMCREGQVVVVSVNHRLNILGYMDLSSFGEEYKNSVNAGIADLVAALEWIRDNISAFGGDPNNVILFGQSGGGGKINVLLQTPAADGLYAKAFNMSGILDKRSSERTTPCNDEMIRQMLAHFGSDDIKTLEKVSYTELWEAFLKVSGRKTGQAGYSGWHPIPNGYYLGDALIYGNRPETAKIPMLISTVFGEFGTFFDYMDVDEDITPEQELELVKATIGEKSYEALMPLFHEAYPERKPLNLLSMDFRFRVPTIQYIKKRAEGNDQTYSFVFNQDFSINGGKTPWHCIDIPFVFHNTSFTPVTQEKGITERLEKQIFESVMAFARTGNPNNPEVPEWPACTPDKEYTMIFDENTRLRINHDHKILPALEERMKDLFEEMMDKSRDKIQH